MAQDTLKTGKDLAKRYDTLFNIWLLLDRPAFTVLLTIFYLRVAKANMSEPIPKSIFGEKWIKLPPELKQHYANQIF